MAETKKQETSRAKAKRLQVTLVEMPGLDTYLVLGEGGEQVKCRCGRPVIATLHNVSVKKQLGPCSKVEIEGK